MGERKFQPNPIQERGQELWEQNSKLAKEAALKLVGEGKLVEALDRVITSYTQNMNDSPEKAKKISEYGNLRGKTDLTEQEVTEFIQQL